MIARILLFCSSYVPLFVIFAVRFPRTAVVWWVVTGVFTVCAVILFLLVATRHEPQIYPIKAVDGDSAAAAYVAGYVLPFVTINEPTTRDFVAYTVFFLMLAVLYTRSSLLGVNPLVYLTPLRVYNVRTECGDTYVLFSRTAPKPGVSIHAAPAFRGLLVWKGNANV